MKSRKSRTRLVSPVPFGFGKVKPNHYRDMLKIAWENRDNLGYAWRILKHGVCDGCSLGPYGLKDDAVKGIHLCLSRLRLLRMNTISALDVNLLGNISYLKQKSGEELRNLGRLPYPMLRKKDEPGFNRISWEEAMKIAGEHMRSMDPEKFAIYTTSRGLTNEVYYLSGKFARLMGTNNIDNAARLCHAASTVALKQMLGISASTCSYRDWIGSELIVLAGANIANNQPVAIKYLHFAKENGARIVVLNPYREPGLENYWVPSVMKTALFGTKLMDDYFSLMVGGDTAFFNGVLKALIENNWVNRAFIENHTQGFEEVRASVLQQKWELLEAHSGTTRQEMLRFAKIYSGVSTAVFIWSMGLTQHTFGVENVKSLVNVALARGMIGRPNVGVVPVRGHSGVQGAAEMGAAPDAYFYGHPVNSENASVVSSCWGFDVSSKKGMAAQAMLDAAHAGKLDVFYIIGGNFLETMPDPLYAREALERIPLRIHQDLILNSSMFADPGEAVLLLPSQTRYEQKGGGTVTSTERRVRFSPEIPGPRIGESRSEWQIIMDLAAEARPDKKHFLQYESADDIRNEIDRVIPIYHGIANLKKETDSFQYGGVRLLENGVCENLPDGKARFASVTPQNEILEPGEFYLTTRRGKQFNSIVYGTEDPGIGSKQRDEIYLNPEDAARLNILEGERIVLKSSTGEFPGICRIGGLHPRTVQVFWPEANLLISRRLDPISQEPDYNTKVTIHKI